MLDIAEGLEPIRDDLDRVELELTQQGRSSVQPVADIARHLLTGGGKRLRPALHLLGARLCGYQGPSSVKLGAVLELIHTATLIHDDIIDEADTRRGQVSANRLWNNTTTVLAGDLLFTEALRLALREHSFRILEILTDVIKTMLEGELIQLTLVGRVDISEVEALEISRRKTASLFGVCLQLGAVLAGRNKQEEESIWCYGVHSGMAFQVIDDLLDFISTPERLGKPVLSDLREGKVTLPLVYALQKSDDSARAKVERVLREKGFFSVSPEEIAAIVRDSGAVEFTRAQARELVAKASGCLSSFPDSPYKRGLEAISRFVLTRDY